MFVVMVALTPCEVILLFFTLEWCYVHTAAKLTCKQIAKWENVLLYLYFWDIFRNHDNYHVFMLMILYFIRR